MGASGSGKTTLMNSLLFRNLSGLKVTGVRSANNKKVTPNNLTAVSAYIQQDDLFIGSLTVKEHLTFQALVRMDSKIPTSQRIERVKDVIFTLGLTKCADTMIGKTGGAPSISGGQRKRLAFASEILTNPAILFCDEPTSGLDSFQAECVVETLSNLAKQGRTVVATIHQPSSDIVELFDKILLMAEGQTAYIGDVKMANKHFESLGFPCPNNYNPVDHYIKVLAVVPGKEEERKKRIEGFCEHFSQSSQGLELKKQTSVLLDQNDDYLNKTSPYKASWNSQFRALMWRGWLSVVREPLIARVRVLQTVVIAMILGAVCFGQEHSEQGVMSINGAIFLMISFLSLPNCLALIDVFSAELPIFLREHSNGMYRTDVYFLTKTMALTPHYLLVPVIFAMIVYFMVGLNLLVERFVIAVCILELITQVAMSFGFMVSCMAPSNQVALILGPSMIMPLFFLGGLFVNNNTIPRYMNWAKYLSWFMYGNEALLINQWIGVDNIRYTCPSLDKSVNCTVTGEYVLNRLHFSKDNFSFDIYMMIVLCVGYRVLAFLALLLKTYRRT